MTFREALREGSRRLKRSGSDTPYLDALVILAETAGMDKERLYSVLADIVPEETCGNYRELLDHRSNGIPVAYLIRRKEFYGREFYVDERVLIPRADTETLVDLALRLIEGNPSIRRIHDLGTGSGCVALTLKAERPDLRVTASDSARAACEVFALNAARLKIEVPLYESPFLESLPGPFDLIVSNPPYLTDDETAQMAKEGWPEPQSALRAGPAGLDCIEQIVAESVQYLSYPGHLLLEAAPAQMPTIREMMKSAGFGGLMTTPDLAGRDRVVSGVNNG
jgi:release factor glutamine methyltransferase